MDPAMCRGVGVGQVTWGGKIEIVPVGGGLCDDWLRVKGEGKAKRAV